MLCQEGSGGAAMCSEMGRLPITGQGHVGSAPRPASPRRAYILPLPEVARHRVCRHRLARGVHYLLVARLIFTHIYGPSGIAPRTLINCLVQVPIEKGRKHWQCVH
jgi:hypothetical protein